MFFSNFTRTQSGNQIIFKNSTPISNVENLKYYKDDSSGIFTKKEFRWSFNNNYWASWEPLNQGNLSSVKLKGNQIFFEIRYTKSNSSSNVTSFSIQYIESKSTNKTSDTSSKKNITTTTTLLSPKKNIGDQLFTNFNRVESGNNIIFKNQIPILYPSSLKYYKDNATGTFDKKEFRWSFNNNYWASWEPLNQGNLSNIKINKNKFLFFEIRYTKSNSSSNVTSFSIYYIGADIEQYDKPKVKEKPSKPSISKPDCNPIETFQKTEIAVTNANTLCGQTCDYYLWRGNHKGQQPIGSITDLKETLTNLSESIVNSITNGYNVGGDGIGVFYDKNENDLLFKRLIAGEGVLISDSSGIISISADASLIAKDPSINDLYNLYSNLEGNLNDLSIYIDSNFLDIDSSISDLYLKYNILDSSIIKGFSNIGSGEGEIFKEINSGIAELRTIVAGNANIDISTNNNQIIISLDASVSGESTWTDPTPVSANLGGINSGEIIPQTSDYNAIKVLEEMLYEYKPPRILSFEPCIGYYEKWNTAYDVSVYGIFDNENFKKLRITDASLYVNGSGYGNSINYGSGIESGSFEWNVTGPTLFEDREYKVTLYSKVNSTLMPEYDLFGSIYYVNPYYFGIVDENINTDNITENDITSLTKLVVPEQTNVINYDVSLNYKKIKFVYAYDASYSDIKTIFDYKNNFNVTSSFDKTIINITSTSSPDPIPYIVYIKNHWISFTSDVSIFKLIFNI